MNSEDCNTGTAPIRKTSYGYWQLLKSGLGMLPGMPQLPFWPMLMFHRIVEISESGGAHGKGFIRAEFDVRPKWRFLPKRWFFWCHFVGKPVMPGCLQVDALWQMLGFFLGWIGTPGDGFALGVGELKFSAKILPGAKRIQFGVDVTKIVRIEKKKTVIAVGNGWVKLDGEIVCAAQDLKVGFSA